MPKPLVTTRPYALEQAPAGKLRRSIEARRKRFALLTLGAVFLLLALGRFL